MWVMVKYSPSMQVVKLWVRHNTTIMVYEMLKVLFVLFLQPIHVDAADKNWS